METQRLIKRLRNLPNNLEKSYINDITNIIDKILEEYDIFYKDTDERVKRSILISRFKIDLLDKEEMVFCHGFSKNGNKCTNKTFDDSNYCKRHYFLSYKEKMDEINDRSIVILDNKLNNKMEIDINNLQSKLIDDTFYYVDDKFIYEKDNLSKVGYIEEEINIEEGINTKNFILTDDPFILSA